MVLFLSKRAPRESVDKTALPDATEKLVKAVIALKDDVLTVVTEAGIERAVNDE